MSKKDKDKAKKSTPEQRPDRLNFTEGYRFARGYMKHVTEILEIKFALDDNCEDDGENNYERKIGEVIHIFLMENNSKLKEYFEKNELLLNTRFLFKNFCITRVCKEKFFNGYSATNFLRCMGLMTAMAFYVYDIYGQNYFLEAMLIIGDILDINIEKGEFKSAEGYDALKEVNNISW